MLEPTLHLVVALAPAITFLLVLIHMDSFKLVSVRVVAGLLLGGAALAGLAYLINGRLIGLFDLKLLSYERFGSPVVEETLKASLLILMFLRNRVGFMVDAAIMGFAIGTGFSVAENSYLLQIFSGANVTVWIVRGFGTAMMHGGATAIFGVLAQSLTDRHNTFNPLYYLPGLGTAIVLHGAFNYLGNPLVATAGAFIVLPLGLLFVFSKSQHGVHDWLISEYESHELLLAQIESGEYAHEQGSRFMRDLTERFGNTTAEDIFAFLQLHTELLLRADRISLDRESGAHPKASSRDAHDFGQLHELEQKIGRTAMLAVWPHLKFSRRELWELYRFEKETRQAA